MANIFKFATSELSQDAFLCWLFASIDDRDSSGKPTQTSEIAKRILLRLLNIEDGEKRDVKIQWIARQWNKIDIVIEVRIDGKLHILAIEDKVKSNVHDGNVKEKSQLDIYRQKLEDRWSVEDRDAKIKCIVYKTSFLKEADHKHESDWDEYGIEEIIKLFEEATKDYGKIDSEILGQYIERLKLIDSCFKGEVDIREWKIWEDGYYDLAWENLFRGIQDAKAIKDKYDFEFNYWRGTYLIVAISVKGKDKELPIIEFQPRQFKFAEDGTIDLPFLIEGYNLKGHPAYKLENVKKWQDNLRRAGFDAKRTGAIQRYLDDDEGNNPRKGVNMICRFVKTFPKECSAVNAFIDELEKWICKVFDALQKEEASS